MDKLELCFRNALKEDYRNLENLSDGIIRTEDGVAFNIHRSILSVSSKYFHAVFCGMNPGRKDVLVPGVKGRIMERILRYIYTSHIQFEPEILADMLIAADYLLLDDFLLKVKAYAIANLTLNNCLSIFAASLSMHLDDMLREIFRFIQVHFEDICSNEKSAFEEIPLVALKYLLKDTNLCVRNESTIWKIIIKWVEADKRHRHVHVPDLVLLLKIKDVSQDLAAMILEHDIISINPFCEEIQQLMQSGVFNNHIEVLLYYFETHKTAGVQLSNYRIPSMLYFIMKKHKEHVYRPTVDVYITYDESIDLWRPIFKTDTPDFLVPIGESIYVFGRDTYHQFTFNSFNFVAKGWARLANPRIPRRDYCVVTLDGLIYLIGGSPISYFVNVHDVEVYNPALNRWADVKPFLPPIEGIKAVSLRSRIYTIGHINEGLTDNLLKIIVQEYDPCYNIWTILSSPKTSSCGYDIITHNDKLYFMGIEVSEKIPIFEVLDPDCCTWTLLARLDYTYTDPKPLILNKQIVVFENYPIELKLMATEGLPPARWNDEQERWEQLKDSSPLHNLCSYEFLINEDEQALKIITDENRNKIRSFRKSPFN